MMTHACIALSAYVIVGRGLRHLDEAKQQQQQQQQLAVTVKVWALISFSIKKTVKVWVIARLQQKHVQTFGFRIIGHNCQACCSVMHERETSTYIDACMQSSVSTTIPSSSLIIYVTATATTALCMTAGVVPRRLLFNQRGRFDSIVVGQLFWQLAASSLTPECRFSLQRASIACTWCLPPAHQHPFGAGGLVATCVPAGSCVGACVPDIMKLQVMSSF